MTRSRTTRMAPIAALALACSTPGGESTASLLETPGEGGALFLTQNAIPDAFMEALFDGRVVVDDAGCIRLDGPDAHTVFWPHRFSLGRQGRVLDSLGTEIGRIGESFRLGGGEVPFLHDGLSISAQDKQLAESRCPGRYWIVGQVS